MPRVIVTEGAAEGLERCSDESFIFLVLFASIGVLFIAKFFARWRLGARMIAIFLLQTRTPHRRFGSRDWLIGDVGRKFKSCAAASVGTLSGVSAYGN